MSLLDVVQRYLPFLNSRAPKASRAESMRLMPTRHPQVTWTTKTDDQSEISGLVLTVPRRDDRIAQVLTKVFQLQGDKTIELDEFGAEVWLLCDGKHRVEQLVDQTAERYRLNRRQAEVSIVTFMRMLSQRRLIGFIAEEKGVSHVSLNPRAKSGKRSRGAKRRH